MLYIFRVTKIPALLYSKFLTMLLLLMFRFSEAVVRRWSTKYMFLKILQNSQKNTCAEVSVLIKLQVSRMVFSCEFSKNFKSTHLNSELLRILDLFCERNKWMTPYQIIFLLLNMTILSVCLSVCLSLSLSLSLSLTLLLHSYFNYFACWPKR